MYPSISKGSMSANGCWARVISSHKKTPNDHWNINLKFRWFELFLLNVTCIFYHVWWARIVFLRNCLNRQPLDWAIFVITEAMVVGGEEIARKSVIAQLQNMAVSESDIRQMEWMNLCIRFIKYSNLQAVPRSNVLVYNLPLVKVLHSLRFRCKTLT